MVETFQKIAIRVVFISPFFHQKSHFTFSRAVMIADHISGQSLESKSGVLKYPKIFGSFKKIQTTQRLIHKHHSHHGSDVNSTYRCLFYCCFGHSWLGAGKVDLIFTMSPASAMRRLTLVIVTA